MSAKKKHNLQGESFVLFREHSEDVKPERWDPEMTLRDCSEEARVGQGEPGCIGVFVTKTR